MTTARAEVSTEEKLDLLHKLAVIRRFEEEVERLNRSGRIPGFLHTSIGQEAVAVGVCEALEPDDYVASTHRGHGHCLAKGADLRATMCELYGKAPGQNRGKGGSMHVSDFSVSMLGANSIVGAGQGIAVGAALSAKLRQSGQIAVAFFGEGAASNGACHETMNLASVLSLPVVFACENNLYAHEAPASHMMPTPNVADRAPAYRMRSWIVDGQDVLAVLGVMREAAAYTRNESRPVLVEAKTYRYHGHHGGDPGRKYRPAEEIAAWRARDPLLLLRDELLAEGAAADKVAERLDRALEDVKDAIEYAEAAAFPDVAEAFQHLLVEDRPRA
jgi:TPP-dependent pyruvate/acetoin dehydrogenase alpha subunit